MCWNSIIEGCRRLNLLKSFSLPLSFRQEKNKKQFHSLSLSQSLSLCLSQFFFPNIFVSLTLSLSFTHSVSDSLWFHSFHTLFFFPIIYLSLYITYIYILYTFLFFSSVCQQNVNFLFFPTKIHLIFIEQSNAIPFGYVIWI